MVLKKSSNNVIVAKFNDIMIKINLSAKQPEIAKVKLISSWFSKDLHKDFKNILTDFYRIYLTLMQSYSEIEDLFSNIIKIAKQETRVSYI